MIIEDIKMIYIILYQQLSDFSIRIRINQPDCFLNTLITLVLSLIVSYL